jgi:hypothetical protein
MKISRKQWLYFFTVLIALVLGFVFAVWLFQYKEQVDITSFTVAVLSGVISLVALFIALQTYLSIDSVNNITKMEGNILDNEHYVTSIPEFIETYPHTSETELRDAVLAELKLKLKSQSKTAVDFADTLQSMIDILVLFPAMGLTKDSAPAITAIIADMKEKASDRTAALGKRVANTNGLLKVRGPVLRNPVSATVYHNYLGLYYRKCAVSLLGEKDAVDVTSLRNWQEAAKAIKPANNERLKRYLALAEEAFDKALLRSHDDPMWLGYILFNQARTAFIRVMVLGESAEKALALMQAAIDARTTLNELIADVVGTSEMTVLQQHYLYQEEYARQLFVNYCLANDHVATYRGAAVGSPKDYEQAVAEFVAPLSDTNRTFLLQLRA